MPPAAAPLDALPVEFLFRLDAALLPPVRLDGAPQGSRLIMGVKGGTVTGPAVNGTCVPGPGGEWATLRADGSLKVDVRLLIETDDGAHIGMFYGGVMTVGEGGAQIRTAPLFETGDERYAWLNSVQAVGLGGPGGLGVAYDVYRVL
jgi:hypothetical protein